jgi:hypothetical protein
MAKQKTFIDMDEKSANPGDRLKHALSLEILARTAEWPSVSYSETHAGAGIYHESKQKPTQPYIRNLRECVLWELLRPTIGKQDNSSALRQRVAGAAYLELLGRWWFEPDKFTSYPGSARQAGEYLKSSNRDFLLCLTEADEQTWRRLRTAVADFPGEAKYQSFEDEIEWLTGPDQLCLIVDPFRCVESFSGHAGLPEDTFGVAKGDIDHRIVRDILRRCQNKKAAVIHFWWPTTSQDGKSGVTAIVTESNRQIRNLFRSWESGAEGRCYCQFDDGHNHASALLGLGNGAAIVREIGQLAWNESWLRSYVRFSSNDS